MCTFGPLFTKFLIGARLGPWFYGLTENHIIFGAPRNAHFRGFCVAITCNTHDFAGNRFAFFCLAAQHTHRHATDMHFRAHRQTRRGHRHEFAGSAGDFRSYRSQIAAIWRPRGWICSQQPELAARCALSGRFLINFKRCAAPPLVLAGLWESHLFVCTEKPRFWGAPYGYTVSYSRFCGK